MKARISKYLENIKQELLTMSDQIYDLAEISEEEVESAKLLEDYLEQMGFQVERDIVELPNSFRAVYEQGEGGPSIGLLAEYDALSMGHGCGHHMQGPCIAGAALAIRELAGDVPVKIVVYGTPAEEAIGGKILMQERGCFEDIDVAFMMHGGDTSCVDVKCMALENFRVTFHGVSAHAAMSPDRGRSAFDAALLSFQGIEFMREHVLEDTRMHYTITNAGGPTNVVPDTATAEYTLRSYDTDYLQDIVDRFMNVIKGAALMTGTTYDIEQDPSFKAKIPCIKLNDLLMKYARLFDAPQLAEPRQKTGSTDFGNVMYELPGSCIRVAFVPVGTTAHSIGYLEAGKSEAAHNAVITGAKIIAASALELIADPMLMKAIRDEFKEKKGIPSR